MKRVQAIIPALVLLAGCRTNAPTDDRAAPSAEPAAQPRPPADPASTCKLRAEARGAPVVADALLAVAPQYFHALHSGGFDAYRGSGQRFPWFDLSDLEHPTVPPNGVRIAAAGPTTLLAISRNGELGVMLRSDDRVRWLGDHFYPETVVETSDGEIIATVRTGSTLGLARIEPDGPLRSHDLGFAERGRVATLAVTADDRPVLAFFTRDGGTLRAMVSFNLERSDAVEVDRVDLPLRVAELSERTGVDLAIAADGPDGVAIAWRPLTDARLTDVGSTWMPPQTPAIAEVRWRSIAADGTLGALHWHATHAQPLDGVTGVGPWGLYPSGMKASTIFGRALFAWVDGDAIMGARAGDETATPLAPSEGNPLIGLRGSEDHRELLLFDSSPRVRAFELACN